jgi:hypothetical protein
MFGSSWKNGSPVLPNPCYNSQTAGLRPIYNKLQYFTNNRNNNIFFVAFTVAHSTQSLE